MNSPTLTLAYCLDTGALVKHYHQEEGTDVVERLFKGSERLIISDLSIIEFYSAIGLKVMQKVRGQTFIYKVFSLINLLVPRGQSNATYCHEDI